MLNVYLPVVISKPVVKKLVGRMNVGLVIIVTIQFIVLIMFVRNLPVVHPLVSTIAVVMVMFYAQMRITSNAMALVVLTNVVNPLVQLLSIAVLMDGVRKQTRKPFPVLSKRAAVTRV